MKKRFPHLLAPLLCCVLLIGGLTVSAATETPGYDPESFGSVADTESFGPPAE